jgi:uncharacterized RDD family membrane protein YckC
MLSTTIGLLETGGGGDGAGFAIAGLIVWLVLIIVQAVLFIAALITIIASKRYTGGGKFLWVLLVFFMPFLGAIGWFLLGRNAQIRTDVP